MSALLSGVPLSFTLSSSSSESFPSGIFNDSRTCFPLPRTTAYKESGHRINTAQEKTGEQPELLNISKISLHPGLLLCVANRSNKKEQQRVQQIIHQEFYKRHFRELREPPFICCTLHAFTSPVSITPSSNFAARDCCPVFEESCLLERATFLETFPNT